MTITTETPPSDRTYRTVCSECFSILLVDGGRRHYFCDITCADNYFGTSLCFRCEDYVHSDVCDGCGSCEECGYGEDCDSCNECQRDKLCYYHGSEYVDNLSRLPYGSFIDGEFTEIARPDTI